MKIHKMSFVTFLCVSVVFLALSWLFMDQTKVTKLLLSWLELDEMTKSWLSNICAGIFASSLVLVGTSYIGYRIEERERCKEYYWKLVMLKQKVVVLSTLPMNSSMEDYYNALVQVNELLIGYFAIFNQDFFNIRRKKIQKLLEIHNVLYELKNLSVGAELYFREYIANTKDSQGNKNYEYRRFKEDINEWKLFIDNYNGEGYFLLKLEKLINDFGELITD